VPGAIYSGILRQGGKEFYTDRNGLKPRLRSTALILPESLMQNSPHFLTFERFYEAANDADEFLLEDDLPEGDI
jgi:hypothetical protein